MTVTNDLTHTIIQNFLSKSTIRKSDFGRLSYQILLRGIREAEYRSFSVDEQKASDYRSILLQLEDVVENFEMFFDEHMNVHGRHKETLKDAISLSSLLIYEDQLDINRAIHLCSTFA